MVKSGAQIREGFQIYMCQQFKKQKLGRGGCVSFLVSVCVSVCVCVHMCMGVRYVRSVPVCEVSGSELCMQFCLCVHACLTICVCMT